MSFLLPMLGSLVVSAIISLVWVEGLSEYYESGQYEQDLKNGVYEQNNFP